MLMLVTNIHISDGSDANDEAAAPEHAAGLSILGLLTAVHLLLLHLHHHDHLHLSLR